MVPMVRGDRTLGLIAVTRAEPTPFPDQLVDLLRTFADQAVIAIENTWLFEAEQQMQATGIAAVPDSNRRGTVGNFSVPKSAAAGARCHYAYCGASSARQIMLISVY